MANTGNSKAQKYKILPKEIESQKALLGSIMLKQEALNEVMDIGSSDSFSVEKHGMIFQEM